MTKNNAIKDNIQLIKLDNTRDKGNIYFGMLIFFIIAALLSIDVIDKLVASEKKPNISCPLNKYTG